MGRSREGDLAAWVSWGDMVVVVTALLLALLGMIRHVKADEEPLRLPLGDIALLAALNAAEEPAAGAGESAPDVTVPAPDCCPACCDPRIFHVLDPWGEDPLWSGRTEALLLWRDNPQGLALFDAVSGGSALNAADLGSGMAAGPRFTLFRHTGDQGAIEFNYLRVESSTAEKALTGDAGFRQSSHGIYCCPDTTVYATVNNRLSASLQSFELNRRFPTDGSWQWLTGFRWVQWRESIGIDAVDTTGLLESRFNTATFNDLYGWQAGADSILLGFGTPFRIEGLGKAGVYYNQAAQTSASFSTLTLPPSDLSVATGTGRTAFVGEIGLTAVYDVYDWLSLRAGYSAFWLGGIATATNQLDQQELCAGQPIIGRTDTGGSVVVQGVTLGLEARY